MAVTITITAVKQAEGPDHIIIDTVPNQAILPPGALKDVVVKMLESVTSQPGWTKTLDVRTSPLRLVRDSE